MMPGNKKPAIPWPTDEYYIDEEEKVIWLMGSYMRSMMLRDRRTTTVPGYEIKLAKYEEIQGLKKDAQQK